MKALGTNGTPDSEKAHGRNLKCLQWGEWKEEEKYGAQDSRYGLVISFLRATLLCLLGLGHVIVPHHLFFLLPSSSILSFPRTKNIYGLFPKPGLAENKGPV